MTRRCHACGEEKAIAPRQQRCESCIADGRKTTRSKQKAVVVSAPKKQRGNGRPTWLASSNWSRPSGLGFDASLEIDELTKRTDIKLKQMTGDLGTQTIWLNQAEAREFHSWLTALLGDA